MRKSGNRASVPEFMNAASRFKPLTPERELELAAAVHGDDPVASAAAREELVCANLRLVVKIAHAFKSYGLPFDDLVQEGSLGLMRAAEKFEAGHGAKFSVYSSWWIKQAMRHAISTKSRLIRVPAEHTMKVIAVGNARQRYAQEHNGALPSVEELSAMTGLPEESIRSVGKYECLCVSYEGGDSDADDDTPGYANTEMASCTEDYCRDDRLALYGAVNELLAALPARGRELVCRYFGVCGVKKETDLQRIAQEVDVPVGSIPGEVARYLSMIRGRISPELASVFIACC